MIQRIQSVYLLAAFICCMVCLTSPLGTFVNEGLAEARMYNLWITLQNGAHDMLVAPLFCLLILAATVQLITIFLFRRRPMQARLCWLAAAPLVLWYLLWAAYSLAGWGCVPAGCTYRPAASVALPFVSLVLTVLARRGILRDERLVKAADRIR